MNVFFNFITNREYCNLKQLGEKAMYNTMFFLETDLGGAMVTLIHWEKYDLGDQGGSWC